MIRFMPFAGFWTTAPVTLLQTAPVELLPSTSLSTGISPPLYRGDGFYVLPPEWTDTEVEIFAAMWQENPVTLELSSEETNALISRINSNVVSTPPS